MTLVNTNWFGTPKNVNEMALQKISSFLTIGSEVEISSVNEVTKALCVYEYGPALSLLELEHFMGQLIKKISSLRNDNDELFCQFFNCISNCCDDKYVVRNTCVMIFKAPKCILVKFGDIETIKYVIHLDNNCLYNLGSNDVPIPYVPENSIQLKDAYLNLRKKVAQKVGQGILSNLNLFETSVEKDTLESNITIDQTGLERQKLQEKQLEVSKSIVQTYTEIKSKEQDVQDSISEIQRLILTPPKSIRNQSDNIFDYVPGNKKINGGKYN